MAFIFSGFLIILANQNSIMISELQFQNELQIIIQNALREDVGDGDHSSLACIPNSAQGKAKLLVKDTGIIAGVAFAKMIFEYVDVMAVTPFLAALIKSTTSFGVS